MKIKTLLSLPCLLLLTNPCSAASDWSWMAFVSNSGSEQNITSDMIYGSISCAGNLTATGSLAASDSGTKDGSITVTDGGTITVGTSLSSVSLDIQDDSSTVTVGTDITVSEETKLSDGATLTVNGDASFDDLTISGETTTATFSGTISSTSTMTLTDDSNLVINNAANLTDVEIEDGSCLTLSSGSSFVVDGTITINANSITDEAMLVIEDSVSLSGVSSIIIIISDEAYEDWTLDSTNYLISDESGTIANIEDLEITVANMSGTAETTDVVYSQVVSGDSIPEPCTTTLSLLALASLCARRRRISN